MDILLLFDNVKGVAMFLFNEPKTVVKVMWRKDIGLNPCLKPQRRSGSNLQLGKKGYHYTMGVYMQEVVS